MQAVHCVTAIISRGAREKAQLSGVSLFGHEGAPFTSCSKVCAHDNLMVIWSEFKAGLRRKGYLSFLHRAMQEAADFSLNKHLPLFTTCLLPTLHLLIPERPQFSRCYLSQVTQLRSKPRIHPNPTSLNQGQM